jgi:hypothetical protein
LAAARDDASTTCFGRQGSHVSDNWKRSWTCLEPAHFAIYDAQISHQDGHAKGTIVQPIPCIITVCILLFASMSFAQESPQQPSTLTPIQQEPAVTEFTPRPPFETDSQPATEPDAAAAVPADSASPKNQVAESSIQQVKSSSLIVNFRQPELQNLKTANKDQARHTVETLQSIGIEATSSELNGQFEVRFQCSNWKSIRVDTNQQLVQWQKYLDLIGIDTVALNPPADSSLPTVSFRLPKPRTAHLEDKDHADALEETFDMLGCKVSTSDHNGHIDLSLECNDWLTIGLTTEDSAHVWQDWLNQNGFETRHTHKH